MSYLFVLVPVFDMFAGMWNWNTWHSDLVFSEWKWTAISELLMANVSLFCYGMAMFIGGFPWNEIFNIESKVHIALEIFNFYLVYASEKDAPNVTN